jgi:cell division protein ZapA (FtsZ GTPase activity inhibitor)
MIAVVVGALLVMGCVMAGLLVMFGLFVMVGRFADTRTSRRRQRAALANSVAAIRSRQGLSSTPAP